MASLDSLGPFFAVEMLDGAPGAASGWRPLGTDLGDTKVVDAWIGRAWARVAGGVEPSSSDRRALGAVLHLGVVARLASPWIGRFLLCGDAQVPHLDDLWWCDDGTTMFPLALEQSWLLTPGLAASERSDSSAEEFARRLVDRIIRPLDEAGLTPSEPIRRGNAASAINTAAGLVARQSAVPLERCGVARELVDATLRLLDGGDPAASGPALSPMFRRTSCCLAYALPGGSRAAVCGDCVLRS